MRHLLFAALAVVCAVGAWADENQYLPLVREGVVWVNLYDNSHMEYDAAAATNRIVEDYYYYRYEFRGTKTIDGKEYMQLYKYTEDRLDVDSHTPVSFWREENKIVYLYSQRESKDVVMYDFQDPVTFWQDKTAGTLFTFNCTGTDDVMVGDDTAKCYHFDEFGDLVEGVGFVDGDLALTFAVAKPDGIVPHEVGFSYLQDLNGAILYKSGNYEAYQALVAGLDDVRVVKTGDGMYYNLLGQPVSTPAPGIYVKDGKKVLVK